MTEAQLPNELENIQDGITSEFEEVNLMDNDDILSDPEFKHTSNSIKRYSSHLPLSNSQMKKELKRNKTTKIGRTTS